MHKPIIPPSIHFTLLYCTVNKHFVIYTRCGKRFVFHTVHSLGGKIPFQHPVRVFVEESRSGETSGSGAQGS